MDFTNELKILKDEFDIKDSEKDEILLQYLENARKYILFYTRRTEKQWLYFFAPILLKIAATDYVRRGSAGIQSQSEGSVSTSFLDGYPKEITDGLSKYRVV